MKKLIALLALVAPSLFATPLPLPPAEQLAHNTVTAIYERVMERPCHFRTADCPDKCGHGMRVAIFRVVSNDSYDRPGQYGDDKLEPGEACMVDLKKGVEGQDPAVIELIKGLKPGEAVQMTITHYYVKSNNCHYPVRPVTEIKRVEAPKQLPDKKDSPVDHEEGVMPIAL